MDLMKIFLGQLLPLVNLREGSVFRVKGSPAVYKIINGEVFRYAEGVGFIREEDTSVLLLGNLLLVKEETK